MAAILALLLAGLFHRSFQRGEILFVNDSTYGQLKAPPNHLPQAFVGEWHPGGWVGMEGPAVSPNLSALLSWVFPPEIFLKLYAPFTLFFLGFSAWVFLRQLKFHPSVCLLGGIAAALNTHFFSIACWGLGAWNLAAGLAFLALAALVTKSIAPLWARCILAGLAVGLNLMEGYDVGVVLSLFVGVYVLWRAGRDTTGPGRIVSVAFGMEVVVIFFAVFIAAHTISTLMRTQVSGMVWAHSNQNAVSKEDRWAPATQWSLPKIETLRVFVPGLFGYRMMDHIAGTNKASAYWGVVGRDPRIADLESDDPQVRATAIDKLIVSPQLHDGLASPDRHIRDQAINELTRGAPSAMRFSGSGEFAGVVVSVLVLFALVNVIRRDDATFSPGERKEIWFWFAVALFAVLAAWGRFGFLYRWLYALPYASTVRNPIKFMHPFHLAWIILAAFGLEGLRRRSAKCRADTAWLGVTALLIMIALAGFLAYRAAAPRLIEYLTTQGFDPATAVGIARFSVAAVGWTLAGVSLCSGVMNVILLGRWRRAGWVALALLMLVDLARADLPWIRYYNFEQTYAANPVLDFLQTAPYEHRVTGRISPRGLGAGLFSPLGQLYLHWVQNDFPYRKIQTLDFAQWPRTPQLDLSYMNNLALQGHDLAQADLWPSLRLWELSNTRYLVTSAELLPLLQQAAPSPDAFRVVMPINVAPKPTVSDVPNPGDFTVVPDPNGPYAVIEYTNALPRARLFGRWETPPDDDAALRALLSREFHPWQTVLLDTNAPGVPPSAGNSADPGTVEITEYSPWQVRLRAQAAIPAILLLNDRFAPEWKVRVDGAPAAVLRCNYLMRGVYLTPGAHVVEFRHPPHLLTLGISLAAWCVGVLTCAVLWLRR
jgi:hypothetical protein